MDGRDAGVLQHRLGRDRLVIDSGQQFTVFGASGAVVFGILSGLLLMAGMGEGVIASA